MCINSVTSFRWPLFFYDKSRKTFLKYSIKISNVNYENKIIYDFLTEEKFDKFEKKIEKWSWL